MSWTLGLLRVARREYDEAIDFYDARSRGGGARFTAAVEKLLSQLRLTPERYPFADGDVREVQVGRYPYCFYYRVTDDQITVVSVFHTSRDPAIWQGRV